MNTKTDGVRKEIVRELFKPARKKFKRRKFESRGIGDTFQIDIADMSQLAKYNKNYKYILVAIDVFTKYGFARALRTKSASEVVTALEDIITSYKWGVPQNIMSDQGKEFFNSAAKKLFQKYSINHYNTYTEMKASVCERFIRTIKTNLYKNFFLNNSYNWVSHLDELIAEYNNKIHSSLHGLAPAEINLENQSELEEERTTIQKHKFKIGDQVRISKIKPTFSKGYVQNWSNELFTIYKLCNTTPPTYILKDEAGNIIKGKFYVEELQKTNYPSTYLIEKVVRKKGNKVLVKWYGIDEKTWIKKADLVL